MRALTAETRLAPANLIQVLFVRDGIDSPVEIASMPGQYQHTLDSVLPEVQKAIDAGVAAIDLFGVPKDEDKDAAGSVAWAEDGILNRAIAAIRQEFGEQIVIIADTCLDEFTDHGHCGPLSTDDFGVVSVDNDAAVEAYCKMAISQAKAGAHTVSLSGMMDGQIAAMRAELADAGYSHDSILAYSANYAQAFISTFPDAAASTYSGDSKT